MLDKKKKITIGLSVLLIIIDQITKFWAFNLEGEGLTFIDNFFELTFHINYGIAFGISVPTPLLILLTLLFIGLGSNYAFKNFDFNRVITILSYSLIISGAISNLIDRLTRNGGVVDFISVWEWPVFNFADSYIVIGVFLLGFFYDKIEKRTEK